MRRFIVFAALMMALQSALAKHYVGGDISLLPEYEKAGAVYKDHAGKTIADLLPWLHDQGMNAMRVRLFVAPDKYTGSDKDPNACQDLDYIIPLCKRIKEDGFALMLDFHYSDTWADPKAQWTPKDWESLTDEQLYQKIYDYTSETLARLKSEGIVPDFIQPGNEISYGMLWGPAGTKTPKKALMGSTANWTRLGRLLTEAIKACREQCPDAGIVIHTERVSQVDVQKNFYNQMKKLNIDYDIIGLSYYPYWHGDMSVLDRGLTSLESNFPDKSIMIVETGYSYKWEVPGTDIDNTDRWTYSDAGQNAFARDLVTTLEAHSAVNGLFWWWMEYNAYKTNLSGWYNAPLFDSNNGRACSALTTICGFADDDSALDDIIADPSAVGDDRWYNLMGQPVDRPSAGVYIHDGKKVLVRP
ncbi:MAG: arabinogalactan endo-1,4-beta-galactosidase [Pseudoflavonifractor sp.]|nr:arabinogalactan endo-1,4-beta-galactosidase [Pseudoflavonifractor sp.]